LVDLRGIFVWLELEELEFGWLGRVTIKFSSSCASSYVPGVIQVYKCDSYSVVVEIFM